MTTGDLRAAFIAIGLGGRKRGKPVEQLLVDLRSDADALRWLEPADLHITVTYLGDVDGDRASAVGMALRPAVATHTCPPLEVGGLGCFPDAQGPRVLWAGVASQGDGLAALKRTIDRAVEPLGFEPERRPFRPHVTLARASSVVARSQAIALLETPRDHPRHRFEVDDVSLFARDETGAARYREVERLELGVA